MTKYSEKLLNVVFNKTRNTKKEVHVMKFLKRNNWIKDPRTMRVEFNKFAINTGKNTIEEMGKIMYYEQIGIIVDEEISLEACIAYVDALFIEKSIKGNLMEKECLSWLNMTCTYGYTWERADDNLDTQFNVDIVGRKEGKVVYIQLKPESYKYVDQTTKAINRSKESKLGCVIHFIYYDRQGRFSV